jgi:hypothetical protein
MTNAIEIAQTIKAQIGMQRLCAIGAQKFLALPEAGAQLGGLYFKASLFGARRCEVMIKLMADDTYTLQLRKPSGLVIAEFNDVYCDHLGRDVEDLVEGWFQTKGEYKPYRAE